MLNKMKIGTTKVFGAEKHGQVGKDIYWHGEKLKQTAPGDEENMYTDDELIVDDDDIGYLYTDQDGGHEKFWSLLEGGFV